MIPEEDNVLQNLMNTILLVAMEDGTITSEELAILKQVKVDIQSIRTALEKVEQNNNLEFGETFIKNFQKNLLQNAYDISQSDHIITPDERNLINSLIKSLIP
ncbi:MAG: TerB family tellurite resistance protein [Candidatus Heimdallarchaeota archaeon]|nr:TerB family tellurite resistance protein [Candidatus Heimdallarchaeota archaeon]